MGKKGWLTIRNVPRMDSSKAGNAHFQEMVKFFKAHKLCPKCRGRGHKMRNVDGTAGFWEAGL